MLIRDDILYKLGLDINAFEDYDEPGELKRHCRTPSPIKRIEDSLYMNNLQNFDYSMTGANFSELNSTFMS